MVLSNKDNVLNYPLSFQKNNYLLGNIVYNIYIII